MNRPRVFVTTAAGDASQASEAASFAARSGLPLLGSSADAPAHELVLEIGPSDIVLLGPEAAGRRSRLDLQPERSDATRRLRRGLRRDDPLARALGLHRRPAGLPPLVVDATAGLLRESLLLAALGCRVVALERSPLLVALGELVLRRCAGDPRLEAAAARIELLRADARDELLRRRPQLVYLDPMFPERRKAALVKLPMQRLQQLVGDDEDAGELLEVARRAALARVVVKRPAGAPPLAGAEPDRVVRAGRTTRFDVYLTPVTPG